MNIFIILFICYILLLLLVVVVYSKDLECNLVRRSWMDCKGSTDNKNTLSRYYHKGNSQSKITNSNFSKIIEFIEAIKPNKFILSTTTTEKKFLYIHPSKIVDTDQYQVEDRGVLEPGITALFTGLVSNACKNENDIIIVDVGVVIMRFFAIFI